MLIELVAEMLEGFVRPVIVIVIAPAACEALNVDIAIVTGDVLLTTHADVVFRVYVVLPRVILHEVSAELERLMVEGNVTSILPYWGLILAVVKVKV